MNGDRINHTLQNFRLAFGSLEQFLTGPIRSNRDRAGVIQAFSSALQAGYISPEEEETWIGMMWDRNLTSHTYHESLATEIVKRIQTRYFPVFKVTMQRLEAQIT